MNAKGIFSCFILLALAACRPAAPAATLAPAAALTSTQPPTAAPTSTQAPTAVPPTQIIRTIAVPTPTSAPAQKPVKIPSNLLLLSAATLNEDGNPNGDVYLLDVGSRKLIDLLKREADDGSPRWSPDGSKIAFVTVAGSSPSVHAIDSSGKNELNLSGELEAGNFSWSPDGTQLVMETGAGELYVSSADGKSLMNITNTPAQAERMPVWSPKGDAIFYFSITNEELYAGVIWAIKPDGTGARKISELECFALYFRDNTSSKYLLALCLEGGYPSDYLLDLDTFALTDLAEAAGSGDVIFFPVISPDGERIAYVSNTEITYSVKVLALDGTQPVIAGVFDNESGNPSDVSIGISWSPDGESLIVEKLSLPDESGSRRAEYYLISRDGSGKVLLSEGIEITKPYIMGSPSFQPAASPASPVKAASSLILFGYEEKPMDEMTGMQNGDIAILDIGNHRLIEILNREANEVAPSWSPDGTKIAFTMMVDDALGLYVVDQDGENEIKVSGEEDAGEYSWSPDSAHLVFDSVGDLIPSNSDLYIASLDGTEPQNITNTPDQGERSPIWSPRGDLIFFTVEADKEMTEEGFIDYKTRYFAAIQPDGSGAQKLPELGCSGYGLQATDSSKYLLNTWCMEGQGDTAGGVKHYALNLDTLKWIDLADITDEMIANLAMSPDGARLAYSIVEGKRVIIKMVNMDGTQPVVAGEFDYDPAAFPDWAPVQIAWSPDGESILVQTLTRVEGKDTYRIDFYLIHHDGSGRLWLTEGMEISAANFLSYPYFQPVSE